MSDDNRSISSYSNHSCEDSNSIQCDGTIILNKEAKCYATSSCYNAHINQTEQNQIFDTQCYGNLAYKEEVLIINLVPLNVMVHIHVKCLNISVQNI